MCARGNGLQTIVIFIMTLHWLRLNVQGLNSPHKRVKVFKFLRKQQIDIACLQENYFSSTSCPKYFDAQYAQRQFDDQGANYFLNLLSLPALTEAHVTLLDRDIQVSEVLQGIKNLKVGKWPGPDGYTALYYRKLAAGVAPHLIAMYNSVKADQ